jgi:hypothetical protein
MRRFWNARTLDGQQRSRSHRAAALYVPFVFERHLQQRAYRLFQQQCDKCTTSTTIECGKNVVEIVRLALLRLLLTLRKAGPSGTLATGFCC